MEKSKHINRKIAADLCSYVDEKNSTLHLEFMVPGVKKENIDLKVNDDSFSLRAEKNDVEYVSTGTGEASKLEKGKSYVREYGFGHEEWLFNFSWIQPAPNKASERFRYGFLQPIGKYWSKYIGNTFDVFLYTITPDRRRLAIGVIHDLYVPNGDELGTAYQHMNERGWLRQMANDLSVIGVDPAALKGPPETIINARFELSKVRFFDPRFFLPEDHVTYQIDRYQPLDWKEKIPIAKKTQNKTGKSRKKSEKNRNRSAIESTTYSPRHDILQNALDEYLRHLYGKESVLYEDDFVDIKLFRNNDSIFFEVKTALTAKSCIREAIGQLLEYSIYPDQQRASELIIVGEVPSTPEDKRYLSFIRTKYGIPVRYIQWDWEKNELVNAP